MATSIICIEYLPDSKFLFNLFSQINRNLHQSDVNMWVLVILCLREKKSVVCDNCSIRKYRAIDCASLSQDRNLPLM
jgi:hypothetical protein